MNPNCDELRDDLRVTMTRIRALVAQGDTQLAQALCWTVNRIRNKIALAETQTGNRSTCVSINLDSSN